MNRLDSTHTQARDPCQLMVIMAIVRKFTEATSSRLVDLQSLFHRIAQNVINIDWPRQLE